MIVAYCGHIGRQRPEPRPVGTAPEQLGILCEESLGPWAPGGPGASKSGVSELQWFTVERFRSHSPFSNYRNGRKHWGTHIEVIYIYIMIICTYIYITLYKHIYICNGYTIYPISGQTCNGDMTPKVLAIQCWGRLWPASYRFDVSHGYVQNGTYPHVESLVGKKR